MSNAVFNSIDNYFAKNDLKNIPERSVFDLSTITTFDATFGALIPFYLEDCLPNDDFNISLVMKIQSLPLACPLFTTIRIRTYFFYVPYYLLWRHFDRFLEGGKDGTYTVEPPYLCNSKSTQTGVPTSSASGTRYLTLDRYSLADYLGFPVHTGSGLSDRTIDYNNTELRISAFPFAAYQRIFKDYFLDEDVQTDNDNYLTWFPDDEMDFQLSDGANSCFGTFTDASSVTSTNFFKQPYLNVLRFANWKKDYFTSSMFSPQRGPAQALPVQGTVNLDASDFANSFFASTSAPRQSYAVVGGHYPDKATFKFPAYLENGSSLSDATDDSVRTGLNSLFSKLKATFTNQVGFTIDDLRLSTKIQEWLERNMRVKARYNEFLRVHFNDAPIDERLTKAYYIGGTSMLLNVSQVLQSSESGTTPQGTATGTANQFDSQYVGKFHSHEFGLIMGIMSIVPDTSYTQSLDRHWTKRSRFEYVFPEFTPLGPQGIFNYEIFFDFANTQGINEKIFGYIGRMDEYRHRRQQTNGALRDYETKLDFYSWTMSREFASTPTLASLAFTSTNSQLGEWTIPSSHSTVRMDAWPTANTQNQFIVQCGTSVRAVRPLPYVNKPSGLI